MTDFFLTDEERSVFDQLYQAAITHHPLYTPDPDMGDLDRRPDHIRITDRAYITIGEASMQDAAERLWGSRGVADQWLVKINGFDPQQTLPDSTPIHIGVVSE